MTSIVKSSHFMSSKKLRLYGQLQTNKKAEFSPSCSGKSGFQPTGCQMLISVTRHGTEINVKLVIPFLISWPIKLWLGDWYVALDHSLGSKVV